MTRRERIIYAMATAVMYTSLMLSGGLVLFALWALIL